MTETKSLSRRRLIQLSGLGFGVTALTNLSGCSLWGANRSGLLLSAYSDAQGKHYIGGVSPEGGDVFSVAVPNRAHDCLVLPASRRAVFFARRPGTQLYVVDIDRGQLTQTVPSQAHRHFYGHGCVSADGRYLFTSENNTESFQGCIGVYDIDDHFRRIDEFSSYGIGPHQLGLLSDGHTLVVANGGILTRPDTGRVKHNLDSMQPSLAYIDSRNGQLLAALRPPHHQQSIRHLDIGPNDKIVVGMQFQGDVDTILPLAYCHQGEGSLVPLQAELSVWQQHQQYIASVCINGTGDRLLLSSPRGGVVSAWDLHSNNLLDVITQRDGAGLAFNRLADEFMMSNGQGQLTSVQARGLQRQSQRSHYFSQRVWDNHMSFFS